MTFYPHEAPSQSEDLNSSHEHSSDTSLSAHEHPGFAHNYSSLPSDSAPDMLQLEQAIAACKTNLGNRLVYLTTDRIGEVSDIGAVELIDIRVAQLQLARVHDPYAASRIADEITRAINTWQAEYLAA